MSNVAKTATEKTFQEKFTRELQRYQWKAPDFLNGNKQKVTVEDLVKNWRRELNRINADQLEGIELTDREFAQVMAKVKAIDNSYEAAKILAMEDGKGKIDGIYRDENLNTIRKQITLTIFKKAEVRGGDSSYQIAREIETENHNRFDMVLLINGLPLINIEQKRADKLTDEAFGQFKRYYRDGEYVHNFMAFSQMMVLCTEDRTEYFATPKSLADFNPSFIFHWTDERNRPVDGYKKVIKKFLMIPMAHQMVGDYLVIDRAKEKENQRHMLMRPYQVYALQAIEAAAFGGGKDDKMPHGGYVWHTTGSGKTITSFKTALFLSTRAGFDKVVFLVDRRELDSRTSENFKAYAAYEGVTVDDTKSTYQLKKILKKRGNGIVVTTIFKLNSLVKELLENEDNSLADKKIVFIVDEAHRSTMGDMMGTIKPYFKKKGLFFGFTGTPLFDENKVKGRINEKSEVINTTEKLFGEKLHEYTIDEAIADKNVLGFHVDYINTGEFKSYDDLREQLMERMKLEHPEYGDIEIEQQVWKFSEAELEKRMAKYRLLLYQDETHIPRVVERILTNWESQSRGRKFNAILTVVQINRVIAYYKEIKKQMQERGIQINVAMTFSIGNENEPENTMLEIEKEMFKDYASFTNIEFVAGDKKFGIDAYFQDIVERATRGGSGRNPKNIDLIIVADQLLTGYDSKWLNTLYVDRSLELQGLVQAYSRTNRVFGKEKEFGTIINFQYPRITEETVNTALKLYGSGGKNSPVIVDLYENAVKKLVTTIETLILSLPEPSEWRSLERDEEKKEEFLISYKAAAVQMNIVEQYYEYHWDTETFGIDEDMWLRYQGAYKNLTRKEKPPMGQEEIIPLSGKTRKVGEQIIDAGFIRKMIESKVTVVDGIQTVDSETLRMIYEEIQELSDKGEDEEAKLLREFVDTELKQKRLSEEIGFDEAYEIWKKKRQEKEIEEFAREWGIDSEILKKSIWAYRSSQPDVIPYLDEIQESIDFSKALNRSAGNGIMHTIMLIKTLREWIKEIS